MAKAGPKDGGGEGGEGSRRCLLSRLCSEERALLHSHFLGSRPLLCPSHQGAALDSLTSMLAEAEQESAESQILVLAERDELGGHTPESLADIFASVFLCAICLLRLHGRRIRAKRPAEDSKSPPCVCSY